MTLSKTVDSLPGLASSQRFWIALSLAVCSLVQFCFGTLHNRFHYQQHPDEPGKVEQILEDSRNHRHPLLMLNTTSAVARIMAAFLPKRFESRHWFAKRFTPSDIAHIGRTVSAAFVALGIFFASASLLIQGKPWAALFASILLSLNGTLNWASHFFKEDASLVFGMGVYLFTATLALERGTRWSRIGWGVGAALLVSSKWVGALMLLGHVAVVICTPNLRPLLRDTATVAGAFVISFAIINNQLLGNLITAKASLDGEFARLSAGREGPVPLLADYKFWFLDLMRHEPGTPILILAIIGVIRTLLRREGPATLAIFVFFAIYVFSLGVTPIPSQRYFVPACFAVLFFAGLGTQALLDYASQIDRVPIRRLASFLILALFLSLAFLSGHSTLKDLDSFSDPGLPAAWQWIRTHLTDQTVVLAQIGRNHLPGGAGRLEDPDATPLPVQIATFDRSGATYDSLKAMGITHLLFRSVDRGGSLRGNGLSPDFFAELDSRGEQVFAVPPGRVHIIQPGVEIFHLR